MTDSSPQKTIISVKVLKNEDGFWIHAKDLSVYIERFPELSAKDVLTRMREELTRAIKEVSKS